VRALAFVPKVELEAHLFRLHCRGKACVLEEAARHVERWPWEAEAEAASLELRERVRRRSWARRKALYVEAEEAKDFARAGDEPAPLEELEVEALLARVRVALIAEPAPRGHCGQDRPEAVEVEAAVAALANEDVAFVVATTTAPALKVSEDNLANEHAAALSPKSSDDCGRQCALRR